MKPAPRVLLTLAGEQPMPSLIPILQYRPDVVVFLYSDRTAPQVADVCAALDLVAELSPRCVRVPIDPAHFIRSADVIPRFWPTIPAGIVIRDGQGRILDWISEASEGRVTCNEAEYAALIRALEAAQAYRPCEVHLYLDSQIVVNQMRGRFAVRSPALRQLNDQAQRLARRFRQVTYTHVPRRNNRLADALANEAVEKRDAS